MNLQEQLAIQAMYDGMVEREAKPKAEKPKSTLGPVVSAGVIEEPAKSRGRPRKASYC